MILRNTFIVSIYGEVCLSTLHRYKTCTS